VTPDTVTERVYWTPEAAPAVRLPNAAAYAEALRALLEQAVTDSAAQLAPHRRTHQRRAGFIGGGGGGGAQLARAGRNLDRLQLAAHLVAPKDDSDAPEYVATRRVIDALGIAVENVDLTVASAARGTGARHQPGRAYADLWYEPLVRAKARQRVSA
jgi:hypothetical protein